MLCVMIIDSDRSVVISNEQILRRIMKQDAVVNTSACLENLQYVACLITSLWSPVVFV